MKEEKVEFNILGAPQSTALSLTNPGALHLGPLLTPGNNETISIVIPLSAQLATLTRNANLAALHQQQVICKQEPSAEMDKRQASPKRPKVNPPRIKEDKEKGCPYPTCSRYGRAFSRAHDLKRHIARHQARENKSEPQEQIYNCTICNAQFYNELIFERHKSTHQNGVHAVTSTSGPPYICNFCKKSFEHETLLNAHLPVHLKNETILQFHQPPPSTHPPTSRYAFPNSVNTQSLASSVSNVAMPLLTGHSSSALVDDEYRLEDMLLIRKHDPTQPTEILPTRPSTSSSTVTVPNGNSKIRCEYCSKTFKTKWTLSSHVAAHEGRFQYQCCICNKKFVRKSHYESHVRSHDAARPFACEYCGKTFKESKHRREHLKRKHPNHRNAIQTLLDSLTASVSEDNTAAAMAAEQAKQLTILMPMNFST